MRTTSLLAALPFAAAPALALAQCPPPASVSAPFFVPVVASGWSIQHFGQNLLPGQLDFVTISLPNPNPIPLASLTGLLCNPVGNTPCWYGDNPSVTWFNLGPSGPVNTTVSIAWPNQAWLIGVQFVAHFGTAGCAAGAGPDQVVMIMGQIN